MAAILKQLIRTFTSLRLTVALLFLAMVLVFIGTLAQVQEGLYQAQARYFKSFVIYWSPKGADWRIPVFPGGYLLGTLLMLNLLAAHAQRFKLTRKKIGIFLIHIGIVLLLVGQLLTDVLSLESHMRLTEGVPKNFTEDALEYELALSDVTDPAFDQVVAVPESILKQRREIRHSQLPFTVRLKSYFPNSLFAWPVAAGAPPGLEGAGRSLNFKEQPLTLKMDDKNIASAEVEVLAEDRPLGTWLVSGWLAEEPLRRIMRQQFGREMIPVIDGAQTFKHQGRTYQIDLRPVRYYRPYAIELLKFTHEKYMGTEIPKNFASRIRLTDAEQNEDREVEIYMNNPLRYRGETFYQGSFDPNDERVSILQVVRNPSWLTPYFSCALVALGLVVQFMSHLIPFIKRRTNEKMDALDTRGRVRRVGPREPARAAAARRV